MATRSRKKRGAVLVSHMVGKRVQLDDETWAEIDAVASESGRTFQEIADEAFADFLKKHEQPVGLKAALEESVGQRRKKTKH
jgi:predicted transcriptional regulator